MNLSDKAAALDADDPLALSRSKFKLPAGKIYLDGNSLGALPRQLPQAIESLINEQWGDDLIGSWNTHGWIEAPTRIGDKIAPLLGAAAGQVICCDSISVNLHKLLCCALSLRPGRNRVVAPLDNFPTDLYMVQGLRNLPGQPAIDLVTVPQQELHAAVDSSTAAVLFSHVNFRSGELLPAATITSAAHAAGALVIVDLAHSAGVMPLELDRWQIDFAVGCGYKFLNGGPGAPAFIYVREPLQAECEQPLSGWMGHARPFDFQADYWPAPGIQRFLCGTPPILSMCALEAALSVFDDCSLHQLRAKSLALGDYYIELVENSRHGDELVLASPLNPDCRGSQVALRHPRAYAICQALSARGVIMDFREPDILRAGFAPLYNSFTEVYQAISELEKILDEDSHLTPEFQLRKTVT